MLTRSVLAVSDTISLCEHTIRFPSIHVTTDHPKAVSDTHHTPVSHVILIIHENKFNRHIHVVLKRATHRHTVITESHTLSRGDSSVTTHQHSNTYIHAKASHTQREGES